MDRQPDTRKRVWGSELLKEAFLCLVFVLLFFPFPFFPFRLSWSLFFAIPVVVHRFLFLPLIWWKQKLLNDQWVEGGKKSVTRKERHRKRGQNEENESKRRERDSGNQAATLDTRDKTLRAKARSHHSFLYIFGGKRERRKDTLAVYICVCGCGSLGSGVIVLEKPGSRTRERERERKCLPSIWVSKMRLGVEKLVCRPVVCSRICTAFSLSLFLSLNGLTGCLDARQEKGLTRYTCPSQLFFSHRLPFILLILEVEIHTRHTHTQSGCQHLSFPPNLLSLLSCCSKSQSGACSIFRSTSLSLFWTTFSTKETHLRLGKRKRKRGTGHIVTPSTFITTFLTRDAWVLFMFKWIQGPKHFIHTASSDRMQCLHSVFALHAMCLTNK